MLWCPVSWGFWGASCSLMTPLWEELLLPSLNSCLWLYRIVWFEIAFRIHLNNLRRHESVSCSFSRYMRCCLCHRWLYESLQSAELLKTDHKLMKPSPVWEHMKPPPNTLTLKRNAYRNHLLSGWTWQLHQSNRKRKWSASPLSRASQRLHYDHPHRDRSFSMCCCTCTGWRIRSGSHNNKHTNTQKTWYYFNVHPGVVLLSNVIIFHRSLT